MTYRFDPPDDDGPDPNRCTCGDELVPCPAAGDGCLTCLRCDGDDGGHRVLLEQLREVREGIEAEAPESGEVSF